MPAEQFEWTNSRGNRLACYAFMPPVTRAVLVYHHGFAEHTQRKRQVFEQMGASGIAVYTYDMYGHGLSEPQAAAERAWVQDWNHMVDDLCGFADIARKRHASCNHLPTNNWFIGGYSIGGLTAAHAVLRQPGQWKGTVLIAAALGLHKHGLVTHIQAALAPLLYATVPKRKIVKALETSQLNPNPAWVADYEADPLCYHDKTCLGTAYQFGQALEDLHKHKQDFKVPAFIIHATGDRITDCQAVKDFASGLSDITFEIIEAGYHDILSKGPLQQSSLAKITHWILATAGAAAEAALLN